VEVEVSTAPRTVPSDKTALARKLMNKTNACFASFLTLHHDETHGRWPWFGPQPAEPRRVARVRPPEAMRLSAPRPRTPAAHAAASLAAHGSVRATAGWLTSGLAAAWHMRAVGQGLRHARLAAQGTPPTTRPSPARSAGSRPLQPREKSHPSIFRCGGLITQIPCRTCEVQLRISKLARFSLNYAATPPLYPTGACTTSASSIRRWRHGPAPQNERSGQCLRRTFPQRCAAEAERQPQPRPNPNLDPTPT